MNERFKELRKYLKMNQEEFGKVLGITKSGISDIESGRRKVTDQHIFMLKTQKNVNETWLRTGEGSMFMEIPEEDAYSQAAQSLLKEDDALAVEGLKLYYSLSPEERETAANYILRLADQIRAHRAGQAEGLPAADQEPSGKNPASMSIEEAEAAYIKSRSMNARKKDSSALSTTKSTVINKNTENAI